MIPLFALLLQTPDTEDNSFVIILSKPLRTVRHLHDRNGTVPFLEWRQEFSDGGLILPTRGLKYGFQGTINAKNLRKIAFHLPTGASMLRPGSYSSPSPPLVPPLFRSKPNHSIFYGGNRIKEVVVCPRVIIEEYTFVLYKKDFSPQ